MFTLVALASRKTTFVSGCCARLCKIFMLIFNNCSSFSSRLSIISGFDKNDNNIGI